MRLLSFVFVAVYDGIIPTGGCVLWLADFRPIKNTPMDMAAMSQAPSQDTIQSPYDAP